MVEVFKTNVEQPLHATFIVRMLRDHFPNARINFDLSDCDKVLRLEGENLAIGKVVHLVNEQGFLCSVLE